MTTGNDPKVPPTSFEKYCDVCEKITRWTSPMPGAVPHLCTEKHENDETACAKCGSKIDHESEAGSMLSMIIMRKTTKYLCDVCSSDIFLGPSPT